MGGKCENCEKDEGSQFQKIGKDKIMKIKLYEDVKIRIIRGSGKVPEFPLLEWNLYQ
jgi:hypothetical protein